MNKSKWHKEINNDFAFAGMISKQIWFRRLNIEGPSKKTSYHIPNLIQYTVCQYTSNSPQSGAQLLRLLLQDTQLAREVCQLPKTARTKHIITFYTGSSKGCIPQNTSPPPSLGIGQAGGGYVASLLLSARLGLTHDLLCLCLCLHC